MTHSDRSIWPLLALKITIDQRIWSLKVRSLWNFASGCTPEDFTFFQPLLTPTEAPKSSSSAEKNVSKDENCSIHISILVIYPSTPLQAKNSIENIRSSSFFVSWGLHQCSTCIFTLLTSLERGSLQNFGSSLLCQYHSQSVSKRYEIIQNINPGWKRAKIYIFFSHGL